MYRPLDEVIYAGIIHCSVMLYGILYLWFFVLSNFTFFITTVGRASIGNTAICNYRTAILRHFPPTTAFFLTQNEICILHEHIHELHAHDKNSVCTALRSNPSVMWTIQKCRNTQHNATYSVFTAEIFCTVALCLSRHRWTLWLCNINFGITSLVIPYLIFPICLLSFCYILYKI